MISPSSSWLHGNHCLMKRRTDCSVHSRTFTISCASWSSQTLYTPGCFSLRGKYTSPYPPLSSANLPHAIPFFSLLPHGSYSSHLRPRHHLASSHLHLYRTLCSKAMSRWAHTVQLLIHTATCYALDEMPFIPPAHFPRLMYVCWWK